MFVLFASVLLLLIHDSQCLIEATAIVHLNGTSTSIGTLRFVQNDAASPVVVSGTLSSLPANSNHGFHIHTNPVSAISPICAEAGPHFNPYNVVHGSPQDDIMHRHVGDLGNITTNANGVANIQISDRIIQFHNSTQSIAGRSVVIHQMFDDGGDGTGQSNTTGNAGGRLACGLIQVTLGD